MCASVESLLLVVSAYASPIRSNVNNILIVILYFIIFLSSIDELLVVQLFLDTPFRIAV